MLQIFNRECLLQAKINKPIYEEMHPGKQFRIVVGSLGLGSKGYFVYGNKKGRIGCEDGDFHTWIEDEEGLIYDCFTPHLHWLALINKEHVFMEEGEFFSLSRRAAKKRGLHYVPATAAGQAAVVNWCAA